ncbi:MAG TPA: M48 family metallopeptidase [Bryobacteraceae bacterium]|nr:M48 family metallopeptidase [Bryobacteraceae bacterium]
MRASRLRSAPRRPTLLFWGALTALVVVCAYIIALGLAVALALLGIGILASFSWTAVIVSVGALTCAAAILWSIVPRRDKFSPPGPALEPSSHRRLFEEISAVAAEFGEPMPASVYLMLEPNAWVAQRGGLMGIGSRRVMALGLPLIAVLTVSEFRAVLAHEFGHYYGGDTGIGPWVQKAREALARSLQSLASDSGFLHVLSRWAYVAFLRLVVVFIFSTYWKLSLRLTLLVSRRWEYRADELACAVAGAHPLVSALEKIAATALAWPSFWNSEAAPALRAGFHAPLAEGFTRFLVAPEISRQVNTLLEKQLSAQKPGPLATHPTFQQRKERALSYAFAAPPHDDASALTLFGHFGPSEVAAVSCRFPEIPTDHLTEVGWDGLGDSLYIPSWTRFTGENRAALSTLRVADIPQALAGVSGIGAQIRDPKGMLLTREQRADRGVSLLWMSFALVLLRDGWKLQAQPGTACLSKEGRKFDPAQTVLSLKRGHISESTFRDLVRELGVAEVSLAPPADSEVVDGVIRRADTTSAV